MGTWGTVHVASRAVDGNINPNIDDGYCAHPDSKDTSVRAWWYVDLEGTYRVAAIVLFNRLESEGKWYKCVTTYSLFKFLLNKSSGNIHTISELLVMSQMSEGKWY